MQAALAASVVLLGVAVAAQSPLTRDQLKYRPTRPTLDADGVELLPVQGRVYLISTGTSSNIAAQIDDQGVILVDSGRPDVSEEVLARIRKLTDAPIRVIVNTSMDLDHIGGNEKLAKAGLPLYSGAMGLNNTPQAQIFAHEKALNQVSVPSGLPSPVPQALWPTDTFVGEKEKMFFNHEPIELLHAAGHTDGDTIVWFRGSDVIATGDAYTTTAYPRFDRAKGGSMQGVLDVLNHVIDIAIAEFNQQGGTRIIPGHGWISNQSDVVEYRDMATIVRDRVRDAMASGKSLDQIKAAKVTLDYDGVYSNQDYTGEMFVEAIYNDLKSTASAPKSVLPTSRKAAPGRR
jgi:glyoxylase-like metal-dependent hydrolase (beta-lactamase superfamily II)